MTPNEIDYLIQTIKSAKTDTQSIEVKESVERLPSSIPETISAFANGSGGTVILGLSESHGFLPAKGFDAHRIADALSQACSDKVTPPVRSEIEIAEHHGSPIVVATIEEMSPRDKPCYVSAKGLYKGSYIRSFDGDRRLSPYEIDRLLEDKTQPAHDVEIVRDATPSDLDSGLFADLLSRQKKLHPRFFAHFSDEDIAVALRILARDDEGTLRPTLAGLLALGTYPQKFFPRLTVTFAAYPGETKASDESVKFLDSEKMVGPIPAIIDDTIAAVQRNSRLGGVMNGIWRVDAPDYPPAAVREAVCNALMHRDYSQLSRGTQIQVNLYSNRLEFLSPGGLFGTVTTETVGVAGYSSTRNQHLANILEATPCEGGFVAENRGTGFQLMKRELAQSHMKAPEVHDSIAMFSLSFYRRADDQTTRSFEMDIVAYIAANEPCSSAQIANDLHLSRNTVNYRLRKLIAEGKIKRIGVERSKSQKYQLP